MSDLDHLIQYWRDTLAEHRFLLSPSVIFLVESTIDALELLKSKGGYS